MYTFKELREIVDTNQRNRKLIKEGLKIFKLFPIFSTFLSILLIVGIISLLVYFIAEYNFYDISDKNQIGDAFGGIANPIIAFFGVFVTFLAFYIQYKFNKEQSKLIEAQRKERLEDKKERDSELYKQNFDKKFYELLKLHNENLKNLSIKTLDGNISGKKCFDLFVNEFDVMLLLVTYIKLPKDKQDKIIINDSEEERNKIKELFLSVFYCFYYGVKHELTIASDEEIPTILVDFINTAENNFADFKYIIDMYDLELIGNPNLDHIIGKGYSSELNGYFRFLFFIVETVVNLDQDKFNYEQKREYLAILRSQISESEQKLLFYYWYSGLGSKWENEHNKFLSDYRMIFDIDSFELFYLINFHEFFLDRIGKYKKINNSDFLFHEY